MKKTFVFSVLLLLLVQVVLAQMKQENYSTYRRSRAQGDTFPALVTATKVETNFFEAVTRKEAKAILAQTAPAFFAHRPHDNDFRNYNFTGLYDSSKAYFYAEYITRNNAAEYEFRILQNDRTTIVPWSNITQFASPDQLPRGENKEMALLGSYKTDFGNFLVADIRKKGSDTILDYSLVTWRTTQPALLDIYTSDEFNAFLKRLGATQQYSSLAPNEIKKWKQRYQEDELDSASSLPKKLIVSADNNDGLVFYLKTINYNRRLEYRLIKDGSPYTDWQKNEFNSHFIWLKNLPPGEYRLDMRFPVQRQNITSYPFLIKPAWHQTTAFKLVAGSLIAAFFGFIILLLRANRQKRLLLAEQQKKGMLETEIKAIRAQLNPHFVFNALSSIQGLINKADIDKANNYLSSFAHLMRDVLNGNNRENNELYREIQTLERYLELEQLRFHFVYKIDTGKGINLSEIQVPSLLLQPLVENAVKHGISALQDKGRIEIVFSETNKDMLVRITDNGSGFDIHHTTQGYGLKLTRQRIALVNEMSKIHSIVMDIDTATETTVNLTFKNWLA